MNASAPRRPGRRPGVSGSRDDILAAARAEFAARGYQGATIRAIARRAAVDPALVMHYFGSKDGLFAESIRTVIDPRAVLSALVEGDRDSIGERLVRFVLGLWTAPEGRDVLLGVLRSASSNETAATALRRLVTREILVPLAETIGLPDARLRASLAGSQIVGLAVARYVVRLEPLASAPEDDVVAWVGPTLQRYLTTRDAAVTRRRRDR